MHSFDAEAREAERASTERGPPLMLRRQYWKYQVSPEPVMQSRPELPPGKLMLAGVREVSRYPNWFGLTSTQCTVCASARFRELSIQA